MGNLKAGNAISRSRSNRHPLKPKYKGNEAPHDYRSAKRQIPPANEETGGQQANARQGQDAAPGEDTYQAPLQTVRQGTGGVSQVWHLPHLFSQSG
jgi:hypothetical protein